METFGGPMNIVLDRGPDASTRRKMERGEILSVAPHVNMHVLSHSPDGATVDAAIARLL